MRYIPYPKRNFIIISILIIGSETALFKLPTTLLGWILRIPLIITIFWLYSALNHLTVLTLYNVDFFQAMLWINGVFAVNALNIIYEFLPGVVNYVLSFIMVSVYWYLLRQAGKYNKLVEEGYDPEFDGEEFAKKMKE